MTIKDRIIQVLEIKSIKKEYFFSKIDMTSANFRGKAKERPLNSNAIANIITELPDVSLHWLITGEGDMLIPQTGSNNVNQSAVGSQSMNISGDGHHIQTSSGNQENLQEEIKALKKENKALKKELEDIRTQNKKLTDKLIDLIN